MAIQSITEGNRGRIMATMDGAGGKSCWASYIVQADGDLYVAKRNFSAT